MGGLGSLPGVILIAAAVALLAIVSFGTPMLKSIYFFTATFSSGEYSGTLKLGALGFCHTLKGAAESCVGPQVGYKLDLADMFPQILDGKIKIPDAIGKWMTYTLVLHIVALGVGGVALIVGLLDMIPGFSMICFPTCLASICGLIAMIALIFDLVIFFMLKAAVNKNPGAHGEIGMAVWMTLAAWLCACFAGCAYGLGRCCCGDCGRKDDRKRDRKRDMELDDYRHDEDMRSHARREESRRQREQGLPNFPEMERMPLTATDKHEDKFLYDEPSDDIPAVGAGYGRREPGPAATMSPPLGHQPQLGYDNGNYDYSYDYGMDAPPHAAYDPSIATAGAAGVGAGAAGVVASGHSYGDPYAAPAHGALGYDDYGAAGGAAGGYYDSQAHDGYQDPYAQQHSNNYDPYAQPYASNSFNNDYGATAYPPQAAGQGAAGMAVAGMAGMAAGTAYSSQQPHSPHAAHAATPMPEATLNPTLTQTMYTTSSAYSNDDGLGAIGRAVTSPTEAQYPADANQSTYVYSSRRVPSVSAGSRRSEVPPAYEAEGAAVPAVLEKGRPV